MYVMEGEGIICGRTVLISLCLEYVGVLEELITWCRSVFSGKYALFQYKGYSAYMYGVHTNNVSWRLKVFK